jgi:protein arginine kinase activator
MTKHCHFCSAKATIHLTEISENVRREMHLCEACGQKRKLIPETTDGPQINLQALLHLLLEQLPPAAEAPASPAALLCPECGLSYAQFRTTGRFGCARDYDAFHASLEPLLEKIHRGLDHAGKAPKSRQHALERTELNERLAAAIAAEQYEAAAQLRDELRQKDTATE